MKYSFISADGHIDLNWMPFDLFVSNASQAMKDRMPYVIEGPDGPQWVTKSGQILGGANGKGSKGIAGASGRKIVQKGKAHRIDRMASTGLYTDGSKGLCRPTTPELRIQDQDLDGIQAEVMYGLLGLSSRLKDREALSELFRIYNDWLHNFCAYDRKRLVGLASIPNHNINEAVAEIYRVAKLGLGGLDVTYSWDMIPMWNSHWDPLWKAAADVNLAVHFHEIGAKPEGPIAENLPEAEKAAAEATVLAQGHMSMSSVLSAIIHGGALERYPTLRVVFAEADIGWIPYVLERMDYEYEDRFKDRLALKMKPSDYFHRQCRATFQNDRIGAKLLDEIGVENAMWGSDYPHPDGVFPDSQEHIKRQFGHLPIETQRKITCENVGKFYGLIP